MEEELKCDHCEKVITDYENDLRHFSGCINKKISMHIHLCQDCTGRYASAHPIFIDFDSIESDLRTRGYWGSKRPGI
ncbi:MAG: hypothetical protein DRQ78_11765 [Epsilonproteobacteria bacterium]|nr:MAG: hypothetical protein DRQ78_11765 [Campylobacterota bacterium]